MAAGERDRFDPFIRGFLFYHAAFLSNFFVCSVSVAEAMDKALRCLTHS
jgi:hypothetical protein